MLYVDNFQSYLAPVRSFLRLKFLRSLNGVEVRRVRALRNTHTHAVRCGCHRQRQHTRLLLNLTNDNVLNTCYTRSEKMVSSIEAHSPWEGALHGFGGARGMPYSAWHIRTSEGETAGSYLPDRNVYIFNNQAPAKVCPLFISTKETVRAACPRLSAGQGRPMPVFISSNR